MSGSEQQADIVADLVIRFPKDEVIRFCLAVAEEHARQSAGEPVQPITIAEIAAWFRRLLAPEQPT